MEERGSGKGVGGEVKGKGGKRSGKRGEGKGGTVRGHPPQKYFGPESPALTSRPDMLS